MGRERAWQGQGARGGLGLAASDGIPVAGAEQIDAGYCLRFLRCIRDCSFATVDVEGPRALTRGVRRFPGIGREDLP